MQVMSLITFLVSGYLSLSRPLMIDCNSQLTDEIMSTSNCSTSGGEFYHCSKKRDTFCYDQNIIEDEGKGANELMLTYLCTNAEFPTGNIKLKFGPCRKLEQKISHAGKMVCQCENYQWICQDK